MHRIAHSPPIIVMPVIVQDVMQVVFTQRGHNWGLGSNSSGADVIQIEELNQSQRNRDKLKDDAIAQLSDQLMALSTRLQEIESDDNSHTTAHKNKFICSNNLIGADLCCRVLKYLQFLFLITEPLYRNFRLERQQIKRLCCSYSKT